MGNRRWSGGSGVGYVYIGGTDDVSQRWDRRCLHRKKIRNQFKTMFPRSAGEYTAFRLSQAVRSNYASVPMSASDLTISRIAQAGCSSSEICDDLCPLWLLTSADVSGTVDVSDGQYVSLVGGTPVDQSALFVVQSSTATPVAGLLYLVKPTSNPIPVIKVSNGTSSLMTVIPTWTEQCPTPLFA